MSVEDENGSRAQKQFNKQRARYLADVNTTRTNPLPERPVLGSVPHYDEQFINEREQEISTTVVSRGPYLGR